MPRLSLLSRHPSLRWLVPLGVVVVGAAVAVGMVSAQTSGPGALPDRSAAQLVADVESSPVHPFTGTVVGSVALGLPTLPTGTSSEAGSLLSLLSGSHTMRVWYGGPTQQRFALLDPDGEQDVFHDGRDVWLWNSGTRMAVHTTLSSAGTAPAVGTMSPGALASRAIAAMTPTTTVNTQGPTRIAGRSAYLLQLVPKSTATTISSVVVGIDGESKVPLSVQVYSRSDPAKAAVDVAFSDFSPSAPDASQFRFSPASDVGVRETATDPRSLVSGLSVIGTGWTSVVRLPAADLLKSAGSQASALIDLLPEVSGTFGKGHVISTPLVSALITTDGTLYAGAVEPDVLEKAADAH